MASTTIPGVSLLPHCARYCLKRDFGLGRENTNLEVRAEYSNLLNHTNLGDPNLTQSSASFGRITSDISPRIAQLSLKLLF